MISLLAIHPLIMYAAKEGDMQMSPSLMVAVYDVMK